MTDKKFNKLVEKTLNSQPEYQDDAEFYLQANEELENKTYEIKLWQKANVLTCSEDEKARYKYIELRVNQLRREAGLEEIIEESKSMVPKKDFQKLEKSKIQEKDLDSNPSKVNQGFWSKLINGDFGLATTFWIFNYVITIILFIIMSLLTNNIHIEAVYVSFFIAILFYKTIVYIGVWRAAKKYDGLVIWAVLARIIVVISWIALIGMVLSVAIPKIAVG